MSEERQHDAARCDSAAAAAPLHASLGQVTATTGSHSDGGTKWNCDVCTYENFPLSRKCTMCRSPKPCLNENIFSLQDGASALPTLDVCGAEAVTERLRPLRISSPPAATPATPVAPSTPVTTPSPAAACSVPKWACPTCTYENWPKAQKCAMCGANNAANVGANTTNTTTTTTTSPPTSLTDTGQAKSVVGINDICNQSGGEQNRRSKRRNANIDRLWLQACLGVVEGSAVCVEAYLDSGGAPARALSAPEVQLLNRPSAFGPGHTLVHLAIRFQRQDILATVLARISGGGPGLKRSPSYVAPDLAAGIRRHIASCVRHKKSPFPCRYIADFCTFSLPAEIEELPGAIQEQLFTELLDREVQQTLEAEPPLINWSHELCTTLGSRLYALWNRSAGDCLLDAVCQAAFGVSDRLGTLRAAMAATLCQPPTLASSLYARWQAWERLQAALLDYCPDESQLRAEWARLAAVATRPHAPTSQLHVFALAHVMRRPLVVYGVDVVSSFRGEALGYARFQGIYLPLLWEPESCSKCPLSVGYTRGHFSALVPLSAYSRRHTYICRESQEENEETIFLPLTDCEGKLLPVHFLTCEEMSDPEGIVRRWMSTCVTSSGVLATTQRPRPRPLLQAQLLEEWLNHYRRLAQQTRGPFPPRLQPAAEFSSDPDTEDE